MTEFTSRWFVIDQDRIDTFARVTEDLAPIHVDPDAPSPFPTTVAHGFLTLSLLSAMAYDAVPPEAGQGINYGFDRIRFVSPVPSRARVRARFTEAGREATLGYVSRQWDVVIEIEGADRPALVATWLTRYTTTVADKEQTEEIQDGSGNDSAGEAPGGASAADDPGRDRPA